uniref:Vacuole membrane protein 1 n=1 Tax=Mesocestoides corti TaxID=53468 RepID=A0A5K3FVP6_MESCO
MNMACQSNRLNSKKRYRSEQDERRILKIWISPLTTLYYFSRECASQSAQVLRNILKYKLRVSFFILICILIGYLRSMDGPHREMFALIEKKAVWYIWWVVLGFLSSCGFGFGLHTFLLYLGPFIAQVTMSAYVCRSLNFPEPPYPDEIVCPENGNSDVSFFDIVRKVQLESILWGFGTAIGELPPYIMARGARLSCNLNDEIELSLNNASSSSELETDVNHSPGSDQKPSAYQRFELLLQRLVTRVGFFGILLCASVPNPLFDLAGMTCGHFLVPFSTFFGATCIGKALIKTHIQQFAVIAASSEDHVEALVNFIGKIPLVGASLRRPLMNYLQYQKDKLQQKTVQSSGSWFQFIVNFIVTMGMISFIVSIINAMAQTNHKKTCRQHKGQHQNQRRQTKKNGPSTNLGGGSKKNCVREKAD